jgi:RNA polymerase sigma-70 factor (ECF subfamily)
VSDADLVVAFREGDRRAGEKLVERYYPKVVNFCRSKAPTAANDIAQQSFLGCFERIDKLRDPASFRAFLFGVVCNQVRYHYRRSKAEGDRLDFGSVSSMDLDPTPSRLIAKQAEQRLLLEALRRIPLDYQIVLELFYWQELRAQDIAEVLEQPLGTVKTRIRRGRILLEETLATLEAPGSLLESTTSNLEDWARGLRGQLG